jgi:hypothetical protein
LTRAELNIAWCQDHLHLPEGRFVGQPLRMAAFMKDDFRAIYDNVHGTRRAIISRGRKNAKTSECGFILLLHLCGPEHRVVRVFRPRSSVSSAGQSSHILIRCSTRRSTIRRDTDFKSSAWGMLP